MTVDFKKKAHILAVHGVQVGDDSGVDAKQNIDKLVQRSLNNSHLSKEFETFQYLYEGQNDRAQELSKIIGKALVADLPLVGAVLEGAIDLVGDVVTASLDTSTAAKIRSGLRAKILESYDAGHPLVVVAHSLGTVYALDVVSELMTDTQYFQGDSRMTWPVRGLITMGSPLGLNAIFETRNLPTLAGAEFRAFPWHNYYNARDPVVTGNLFGAPIKIQGARGPVEENYGPKARNAKWLLEGHRVTSGDKWLLAHLAYWNRIQIGGKIVDMLFG